jgi:hypothetical protein
VASPTNAESRALAPTVIIACRVMQEHLQRLLPPHMPVTYMDIGLHNTPKKLAAALQAEIVAISEPSNVIVGYGLCGNGLVGVKSGPHTLIVPRTHDCVAIFLGSQQRYMQRFFANPNTYYLTRGWLEAKDEPLQDYLDYVRDYGEEDADYLVEMKYRHYRKLTMVGYSQQELDEYRPMALRVAEFCASRWNMEYEEIIGSTALLEALLDMPGNLDAGNAEFVVLKPGGEIQAEMFLQDGEPVPAQVPGRRGE